LTICPTRTIGFFHRRNVVVLLPCITSGRYALRNPSLATSALQSRLPSALFTQLTSIVVNFQWMANARGPAMGILEEYSDPALWTYLLNTSTFKSLSPPGLIVRMIGSLSPGCAVLYTRSLSMLGSRLRLRANVR